MTALRLASGGLAAGFGGPVVDWTASGVIRVLAVIEP
ncbi:hypothetical protein DFR72_120155 [Lentzea flaviverrucosa]|uniref:Uncharacterized protein n=1 Tax=Lentzea flaviverrucosa TaxID=200379 RepID=A0A1H9KN11_9PSEU|nr:hypothetical protein DFR72_120155 [Lentzea flaviverrucosa]SER00556.1 hypothetical protein SAMN05216195_103654 [Lentzea flaviverrucosa]